MSDNHVYEHTCQFCGKKYVTEFEKGCFNICPKCSDTKEGAKYIKTRNRLQYLENKANWYAGRVEEVTKKLKEAEDAVREVAGGAK